MPASRQTIIELHQRGLSPAKIARHLSVAPTTVSYHLERAGSGAEEPKPRPVAEVPAGAVVHSCTREAVRQLLDHGHTHVEIARRLGISKQTVSYHARRLGAPIDAAAARRYDWSAVQRYYDDGHSVRDCIRHFGFSSGSWYEAVRRGAVVARPGATPLAELLVAGTYRGRDNLKLRLLKAGLKRNCCELCGITGWRGEPLSLELHHVNGDRLDNRLENLQLLCPNCHSQTETYSGRNGHGRAPAGGDRFDRV